MRGNRRWGAIYGTLFLCLALALPALAADRIRPSALAGTWYPADPQELGDYVDKLLDAVKPEQPDMPVRALIVPHAGYPFSGATAAKVFSQVRGREYKRVILLAPSHHSGFRGLSIADVEAYQTPLGDVSLDAPAVAELRKSDFVISDPAAHVREHSIEIELPFLQRTLKPGWKLVPILVGQMEREDYKKAADLLRPLADEETLVVVSSDFTHFGSRFGYMPFPVNAETPQKIRALDDGAMKYIVARDATGLLDYQERTRITICGYRPLALLLTLLPRDVRIQQIAYATSGELTGDWGSSVSYAGMLVTGPTPISGGLPNKKAAGAQIDKADLLALHRLAVLGVETAVLGPSDERSADIRTIVEGLPERLKEPSGAFVTLKENGQLRGCIGYILPRKPLYEAVLENGFNAARNDRRFMPVRGDELGDLEIEVSVLSEPRSIDSYDQFQVGEQGVILSKDGHQAVFLPEVAPEQGWTREDTLSHLAQKAGLAPDAWRDGASFEVFTSDKYAAPYPAPAKDLGPLAGMQGAPTHRRGSTNRK
jgi:AmmeMemoRadiSam system protein B/AmmeMemoRadiSam system protein A